MSRPYAPGVSALLPLESWLARAGSGGERVRTDRLVAGAASRAFAEMRRDESDVVGAPGRAGVVVEEANPSTGLERMAHPREGEVCAESLPIDVAAGLRDRRA